MHGFCFFNIPWRNELINLWIWSGANEFGQLGDGTEEGRKHPKKVKQLETEFVKSVSCGAHCTAAIAEPRENDGSMSTSRLWVWGQNQVVYPCENCDLSFKYGYAFFFTYYNFGKFSSFHTGFKLSTFIMGGLCTKHGIYFVYIFIFSFRQRTFKAESPYEANDLR